MWAEEIAAFVYCVTDMHICTHTNSTAPSAHLISSSSSTTTYQSIPPASIPLTWPLHPTTQNAQTCASSPIRKPLPQVPRLPSPPLAGGVEPHACNYAPGPVRSGLVWSGLPGWENRGRGGLLFHVIPLALIW